MSSSGIDRLGTDARQVASNRAEWFPTTQSTLVKASYKTWKQIEGFKTGLFTLYGINSLSLLVKC